MTDDLDEFEGSNPDRRAFLKRLLIGTTFAAPIMASFSMGGIDSVFARTPGSTTLAANTNTTTTTTTTTVPPTTTVASTTSPAAAAARPVEAKPNFTG